MLTDFHSHILPGIDDGSRNVEQSISMLQAEAAQGIARVVATPHFYANHNDPNRFLDRRAKAAEALSLAAAGETGLPEVVVGTEVHYFSGMSHSEVLPQLAIAGTRHILIEMPHAPWSESMYRELAEIYTARKLTPVIAHIDRYIRPLHTHGIPGRLEELPVLVQANADFFLDRSMAGMALRMLRKKQIHLLGSDCHNLSDRAPNLGAAVKVIGNRLGQDALARIRGYENRILTKV
ncbi:MAG: capsular polysaccharide biosynthesis protein [Ruminococcaceae bacterium]|nr:capsular polysaccharide biosynthesis protein [Oscillospiraceae bacterium]